MCGAVEGGIGYFAVITDAKRGGEGNLEWLEVTVEDAEGEDAFEPTVVRATQMEKAAREMVTPEYNLNDEMKARIHAMLLTRDSCEIDSYDAQAIFQQAAFGEQVFG